MTGPYICPICLVVFHAVGEFVYHRPYCEDDEGGEHRGR